MEGENVVTALCLALLLASAPRAFPERLGYDDFIAELQRRASLGDRAERERSIDELWSRLRREGQIPFREGNRVAFVFLDEMDDTREVAWRGDMTDWELVGSHRGRRLGESRVWLLEDVLPPDSRVDYKLYRNGNQWLLDPDNPRRQVGGFGPNSELRMPDYLPPPEVESREGIERGRLGDPVRLASATLGYDVAYRVYTPAGYEGGTERLPVAYVTDGQDYAHEQMGRMTFMLDNRIADGGLPPLIAVFIDPRDPRSGDNRRESEYGEHPELFARFLADELVPRVDGDYRTRTEAGARVVVGTSLGGLLAARAVLDQHRVLGAALIQSPAFRYDLQRHADRLRADWRAAERPPVRVFIDVGTLYDGLELTREFRDTLRERGGALRYVEVNEGHSWGHWRAWLDDGLAFCLGWRQSR